MRALRTPMLVLPLAALIGTSIHSQHQLQDLGGHWTLERVQFPREGEAWRPGRAVEATHITQTDRDLRIEGSRGLYEGTAPIETYKLDGSTFVYIQSFGDWWRKSQTWVEREGSTLVLRLRTRAGWYNAGSPDNEELVRPHGDVFRRVRREGNRLTVRTEAFSEDDPPDRANPKSTQVFVWTE
jgi:hypothetical protein